MDAKMVLPRIAVCAALLAGCDRMKEPVAAPKTEFSSVVRPVPSQVLSTPESSKK